MINLENVVTELKIGCLGRTFYCLHAEMQRRFLLMTNSVLRSSLRRVDSLMGTSPSVAFDLVCQFVLVLE